MWSGLPWLVPQGTGAGTVPAIAALKLLSTAAQLTPCVPTRHDSSATTTGASLEAALPTSAPILTDVMMLSDTPNCWKLQLHSAQFKHQGTDLQSCCAPKSRHSAWHGSNGTVTQLGRCRSGDSTSEAQSNFRSAAAPVDSPRCLIAARPLLTQTLLSSSDTATLSNPAPLPLHSPKLESHFNIAARNSSNSANRQHLCTFASSAITRSARCQARSSTSSAVSAGVRSFHAWYYHSKLRNWQVQAMKSVADVEGLIQDPAIRHDYINLARLLDKLYHIVAKGSSPATPTVAGGLLSHLQPAEQSRLAAVVANVVDLVRVRSKWYDPRYAAKVVYRTAQLGHTDHKLLEDLTARVLARLDEAYSKDLNMLLRGLELHEHPLSPELLAGVQQFMTAKIPTGRMPPENIAGMLSSLIRYYTTVSQPLRELVQQDLKRRVSVYAPKALAGVLWCISRSGQHLDPAVLNIASQHMQAIALQHANGVIMLRFLHAVALLDTTARTSWLEQHSGLMQEAELMLSADVVQYTPERLVYVYKVMALLGHRPSLQLQRAHTRAVERSINMFGLSQRAALQATYNTLGLLTPLELTRHLDKGHQQLDAQPQH